MPPLPTDSLAEGRGLDLLPHLMTDTLQQAGMKARTCGQSGSLHDANCFGLCCQRSVARKHGHHLLRKQM